MVKAAEKSAVLPSKFKSRRHTPCISHGPLGLPCALWAGVKSLITPRKTMPPKCSWLRPCAAALIPSASTRTHAPTDQKKVLLCIVASINFGNTPCLVELLQAVRESLAILFPALPPITRTGDKNCNAPQKKLVGGSERGGTHSVEKAIPLC